MKKKLQRKLAYLAASSLAGVAALTVMISASIVYINQPEVPDELLK